MKPDHHADRYPDLAIQRRLLQAESALLRHSLHQQASQLSAPLWSAADKVQAGARWVQAHPVVLVGTAGLALMLAVRRPAMALSCLGKGLAWWLVWLQRSR